MKISGDGIGMLTYSPQCLVMKAFIKQCPLIGLYVAIFGKVLKNYVELRKIKNFIAQCIETPNWPISCHCLS
jgi:hypothetical protein